MRKDAGPPGRPVSGARAEAARLGQSDNISWRLAERMPSVVQADRLARALGTTLSEMLAGVEPEMIPS